ACAQCQKRKSKCDGSRPMCTACIKRKDAQCLYPVREGAMSRYSDLKETYSQLQRENQDLRELFCYIKRRPEDEAFEIYKRLRTADDPIQVLNFFRHADTLLLMPSSTGALASDKKAEDLELETQAASDLKLPARPWTAVAGDGLVSCLVSSFFKWDNPLLFSFIDQELFLRDMRAGSSPYCSPFLVNSICALRSIMSDKARTFNRAANLDLCSLFTAEAKKQLDLEAGKVSLTTIQGLLILFILSCCDGTNRAGAVYRMAAFDMLQKLKPERLVRRLRDDVRDQAEQKRALSTLCWGVYLLECVLSNAYLKPSTISVPKIPWAVIHNDPNTPNIDFRGLPFGLGSPAPPLVPGITQQAYRLAILYHDVMNYNTQIHSSLIGDENDMSKRRGYYAELALFEESLPERLRYRNNPAPDTLFLKSLINLVAYNLTRPLPFSTEIATGGVHHTSKSLLLDLCSTDVDILES
ncbi:nitrogen assimilation transcription factor nirA, partial [Podospora fimiseda]